MFWEAFQKQNFNTRKLFLISIILYEGEVTEEVSSLLRPCPECGWRIDGLSVEAGAERG